MNNAWETSSRDQGSENLPWMTNRQVEGEDTEMQELFKTGNLIFFLSKHENYIGIFLQNPAQSWLSRVWRLAWKFPTGQMMKTNRLADEM